MLEVFGLTRAAEFVYLAMLEYPDLDIDDLARRLKLELPELRANLDDLARYSLVQTAADGKSRRAVNPEVGLSVLLAHQQADVSRRQAEIEEGRAVCDAFLAERAEARAEAAELGMERLEGIEMIRERLHELAATCTWEACSFMPGGAQSAASLEASRALDAEAIGRGVRLRTVYLDSVRNDKPTLDYATWLGELGSEVRTFPALPIRMLIVDRKRAVIPVDADNTAGAALLISGSGIVAGLMALFDLIWKSAVPLVSRRRRGQDGLSAQQRQVLNLLAAGDTDEMIARRLGVSVRTSRRVASDLLSKLAARSRFQAGAHAVVRGWLDADDLDLAENPRPSPNHSRGLGTGRVVR